MSVAVDGTVYLMTRNTENPVVALSPEGKFLRTFGAGFFTNRTHAILAAYDGFIYCVDDGVHTVTKWTPEGELLMTNGTSGESSAKFSGLPFNRSTDTAVAADGSLYVSNRYGTHGSTTTPPKANCWTRGANQRSTPVSLCYRTTSPLDGERLYVADRELHRVQVFTLDGMLLAVWNNIHRPCAIAVGPDHNIYVGELNGVPLMEGAPGMGHRINILDPVGLSWHASTTLRKARNPGSSSHRMGCQ